MELARLELAILACKTRPRCPTLLLAWDDGLQVSVPVRQCPSPLVSVVGVTPAVAVAMVTSRRGRNGRPVERLHLYPGEMDRYAGLLGDAAEDSDPAKIRPDDDEGEEAAP